jgi:hypothetical protein
LPELAARMVFLAVTPVSTTREMVLQKLADGSAFASSAMS